MRSCDNLKLLYPYYHSAYGHKTWLATELPWEASTQNISPFFGQVILKDHVTNLNNYIFITTISMAKKLVGTVT